MAKYDILLIGDGANLLQTIGWVLDYKGFAVKVTASPEAALEALVKKNYDLVIARLSDDDRESLEILKRARQLNSKVKIMVVSANNQTVFPLEAYELEADDYLLMPVNTPELWRRVNRCLEEREVIDFQPARSSAARAGRGDLTKPQMTLMFHDIRGSMVAAAASLKLMARGANGEMSEPARAKLHEATHRIENTIHLMEDFIDRSMADRRSGGTAEEPLDLTEDIVKPVLAELAAEIRDQGITLVNRLPNQGAGKVPVRGSKLWLKCAFRNLLNNGIKYGGYGCTIVVDYETQGSACRLKVYNSGEPVPEASRSMLFSYGRSPQRTKKSYRGLGLGLSLSRELIQNYGGDIWYEPKTGGANFVISLPQR